MNKYIKNTFVSLLLLCAGGSLAACQSEEPVLPEVEQPKVTIVEGNWAVNEDKTNIVATEGITPKVKFNDDGYWVFSIQTEIAYTQGIKVTTNTTTSTYKVGDTDTGIKLTSGVTPVVSDEDGKCLLVITSKTKKKSNDVYFLEENDFDQCDALNPDGANK